MLVSECGMEDILAEANDGSMTLAGIGRVTPERMPHFEQSAWNGKMTELLLELSKNFQYVIIDAPAGLGEIGRAHV